MKHCLNWWDLLWSGFGFAMGAGIFIFTGQEAHDHAGPATVLSYVACSRNPHHQRIICLPKRVEPGDLAVFITASNILLESILRSAAVARSWTSYFTTLLDCHPNSLHMHTNVRDGFNLLDPIAAGILAIAAMTAMTSAKGNSSLNWITSAVNVVMILFVIVIGFGHATTSNLQPVLPHGAVGIFQAAVTVYFAYGNHGRGNIRSNQGYTFRIVRINVNHRQIYCLMALFLSMMQKYTDVDPNASYSVSLQSVGMKWAKYLVILGALRGMTTVLLVRAFGQMRYTTHIARAHHDSTSVFPFQELLYMN